MGRFNPPIHPARVDAPQYLFVPARWMDGPRPPMTVWMRISVQPEPYAVQNTDTGTAS